jgi:hypothetical protein
MIGDGDYGEIGGIKIGRENRGTRRKPRYSEKTEVLGENLPQCRFIHHKPHMLLGCEPGPPRWEAGD